jgi:16S rRNA (uracil1498-N3)-methyltransferase
VTAAAWAASAPAAAHVVVDSALDDQLIVDGDDGHHLQRVRRLRAGEAVTAADGAGAWRPYEVAEVQHGRLVLEAAGETRVEPTLVPPLTVAFAITKADKPEAVVARLTELGVDRLIPVVARRSVAQWDGARAEAALVRLRRVAREAAMQCRRARLPEIGTPLPVTSLARRTGLVVADRDGPAVGALAEPGPDGWLVAVGPEGGFDDDELGALGGAPRFGVGPHVLRAETAAVAAAAALSGYRRREPATERGIAT